MATPLNLIVYAAKHAIISTLELGEGAHDGH